MTTRDEDRRDISLELDRPEHAPSRRAETLPAPPPPEHFETATPEHPPGVDAETSERRAIALEHEETRELDASEE